MTRADLQVQDDGQHLIIRRADGKSGIPWKLLQAIKTEAWGAAAWAVEVYPPKSELVNEQNARHLWRVPYWLGVPNLKGDRDFLCTECNC